MRCYDLHCQAKLAGFNLLPTPYDRLQHLKHGRNALIETAQGSLYVSFPYALLSGVESPLLPSYADVLRRQNPEP